jgi:hypothetical protein
MNPPLLITWSGRVARVACYAAIAVLKHLHIPMGLSFCSSRCTAPNHLDRLFQPLPLFVWLERSVQTVELCTSRCSFVRALWLAER